MNLKFPTPNGNNSMQFRHRNEDPSLKDKKVTHLQSKTFLILNNFFFTRSKTLKFCNYFLFDMNIVSAKNGLYIYFGFGYIDFSFLKMVPFFNKQLQPNL